MKLNEINKYDKMHRILLKDLDGNFNFCFCFRFCVMYLFPFTSLSADLLSALTPFYLDHSIYGKKNKLFILQRHIYRVSIYMYINIHNIYTYVYKHACAYILF